MQEPPKVVDLMEALRRSLDSVSTEKKKPAKIAMVKPVKAQGRQRRAQAQGRLSRSAVLTRSASLTSQLFCASRWRSARISVYSAVRFQTRLAISVSCTAFRP